MVVGVVVLAMTLGTTGCSRNEEPPPDPLAQALVLAPPAPASPTTVPSSTTTPTIEPSAVRALTATEVAAAQAQLVEAEDCPVALADLRLVAVPYRSYDGAVRRGTLIVNADVAEGVADVFEHLFAENYPIQRMDAIDPLPVDDANRMSSNNTVGFKCRAVRGGTAWSQHAYGHAVDINPVDNPSVSNGSATPPLGDDRVDRSIDEPGMIREGDLVTAAFGRLGWGWGGRWTSHQDYMHFSVNGN